MAEPFSFELVTPERLLISEEVQEVIVPGADGDFGVLKEHAPLMSTVRSGILVVKRSGVEDRIFVRGGFADISPSGLTVLTERAIRVEDMDRVKLAQELKNAEDDAENAQNEATRTRAATLAADLREELAVLENAS